MQRDTFSILFFIKRNRPLKNGECPVLVRITVNGISQETLIGSSILPSVWNQQAERATGKDRLSFEVNAYLDTVRSRIMQIHRQMEMDGKHITAREIKEQLRGNGARPKMLLEEFRKHNDKCRRLIGTEYAPTTVSRYDRVARYLGEYMQAFYRREDIPLLRIPLGILEAYKDDVQCRARGVLLPVLSNQRMNGYLKELADLCGINKNLSTHVARHTFATVALTHGISIDSVAKMLGHSRTDQTRHYARVLDSKISNEMNQLTSAVSLMEYESLR